MKLIFLLIIIFLKINFITAFNSSSESYLITTDIPVIINTTDDSRHDIKDKW